GVPPSPSVRLRWRPSARRASTHVQTAQPAPRGTRLRTGRDGEAQTCGRQCPAQPGTDSHRLTATSRHLRRQRAPVPMLPVTHAREPKTMDGLAAVGNTSIVRLRKIVPRNGATVLVKLEWENPTGSMKDRMARAVIARAEADGRLKAGDTVIEYTGGSTGTSLALVCAARRYRIRLVSSDAFSQEKRDHMIALGAELTLVPSENWLSTKELFQDMVEAARRMSLEPRSYWVDQLHNHDTITGYHPLGEEIWEQTGGEVAAFVQAVGTGASSRGVATVLRRHKPGVEIVAVEPAESSVLR